MKQLMLGAVAVGLMGLVGCQSDTMQAPMLVLSGSQYGAYETPDGKVSVITHFPKGTQIRASDGNFYTVPDDIRPKPADGE